MKFLFALLLCFFPFAVKCQTVNQQINSAVASLDSDAQFKHAIISLYVVNSKTGKIVYEKNAQTGMAPASGQKVITSTTAFELLGKNYTYKTYIGYEGKINKDALDGDIFLEGRGDPTLGSWRWEQTKPENVLNKIAATITKNKIKNIHGDVYIVDDAFSYNPVPDGWIWQDIGNYYGAGAWAFNWHENQYDLYLKSGNKVGDSTTIVSTESADLKNNIVNLVTTAAKGSGDNVYIYATPFNEHIFASGTIPVGENKFKVSGSMPNPPFEFGKTLLSFLQKNGTAVSGKIISNNFIKSNTLIHVRILDSLISPPLDSINYWFLKKSVNLFGEALVKTIALEKKGNGSTDSGVEIIRDFWSKRGIERSALKIIDGSGLSTGNRVTTNALVTVLQYAKLQNWFPSFYNALPEANGIKMKDGYINGVRSYSGYVKSTSGGEYTFSFIINNFDGSAGTVREKMWRILNLLK